MQYCNFSVFGDVKDSFTYRRDWTSHMNLHCGTIYIAELLLQMSHVAWSVMCVCLFFGWAHGWAVQNRLNLVAHCCEAKGHMLGLDKVQIIYGKGYFWGRHMAGPLWRIYRRRHVPAQRTRRTNAFADVMGDKTAMRPFAKLMWTLVSWCGFSPLFSTSHLYFSLRWADCCVQLRDTYCKPFQMWFFVYIVLQQLTRFELTRCVARSLW